MKSKVPFFSYIIVLKSIFVCSFFSFNLFSLGSKKWQFSDFRAEKNKSELKQKGHEPSRAENLSAQAMARASSARTHH